MTRAAKGYNRLAPYYASLEYLVFGTALVQARTALLDDLPKLETALILGEGDGRFLHTFLQKQPDCRVTCVEQSDQMVRRARARLEPVQAERVTFLVQDALIFTPDSNAYDAVITLFFLDCFTEDKLRYLIPKLADGLRPGGVWYYVDFQVPERGWRRVRGWVMLEAMHTFFRLTTGLEPRQLADPKPLFRENGLVLKRQRNLNFGLLNAQLYKRSRRINFKDKGGSSLPIHPSRL